MPTFWEELWSGIKAELPLGLGVIPFGMIYGVLALEAGIPPDQAQAMSAIVFAGSAQFVTTQLVAISAPGLVLVLTIAVVNLRHALYSASIAPHMQKLSTPRKFFLAYLLTDEAYAVSIGRLERTDQSPYKVAYYLGAGLALWTSWQLSTAAGIFLGVVVPESWSLDFTLALTFIALVIPTLNDRPSQLAALTAGIIALLGMGLPYKLGLIAAALSGILAGIWLERRA